MNQKILRYKAILKLIVLVSIIIIIPIIFYFCFHNTIMNKEWLSDLPDFLEQYKSIAIFILIFLQILQVIVSVIPGQPIQIAASYLYGIVPGYLISITGAVIGATIAFYLARLLGTDAMHLMFGEEKVNYYCKKLNSSKAYYLVFLIYLIPGVPKDVVAYVAGITEIKFLPFITLSTIGRSLGIIGSLLVGLCLRNNNYVALGAVVLAAIVIFIICIWKRSIIMRFIDRIEEKGSSKIAD